MMQCTNNIQLRLMLEIMNKHAKGIGLIIALMSFVCGAVAAVVTRNNDMNNIELKNISQDKQIQNIQITRLAADEKAATFRTDITIIQTDVKWIREKLSE